MRWILFFVCELGLYFALTFERCHRSSWWWSALVWLLFCPIVKLDGGADFCMRAPIPLFLVLSVFVFVTTVHYIGVHSWKWIALVVCLAIGSYVTTKEMIWTLYHCSRLGFGVVINDKIVTFDQDLESRFAEEYNWPGIGDWITSRCNVKDPDKLFFYKWLARRQVPPSHDYAIDARGQGK